LRAYLRLDPELADKKNHYPDGAFSAFVSLICYGEQQPFRGRFKTKAILRAYLGRRSRWLTFLISHGDLVELADGVIYLDGWDEWQEGDWKVSERVGRIRNRSHSARKVAPDVTLSVTADVTPETVTPTVTHSESAAIATSGRLQATSGKHINGAFRTDLSLPATIELVFHHWVSVCGRTGRTKLDDKRKRAVDSALVNYPLEDVLDAVEGWRYLPFNVEHGFNELTLLLRDSAHIERYRDAKRNPITPTVPSARYLMEQAQRLREQDQ
jgi:hypothetical protein